jgi:hypothetical protein
MIVTALAALLVAVGPPPPTQPGPWRQVGASVTSRPGKALHFYRQPQNPKAVALVAVSSSARPIRVSWWSYCEVYDDDTMDATNQQTVTGVHRVVAYPPVLDGATLCQVAVNASVGGTARVTAAVFAY